ncbi:type II toxin-antitoxin system VapC family toxin [Phenylobacterium sp.]|uniref:type II toxin-antitoxin system VapC family toxin n=1 Tax=Phenylobacterium sp. TaxID=1871053 RepID=UPI00301B7CD9
MSLLLLDTCTVIWVAQDAPLDATAKRAIREAAGRGDLYVSPASAWEIGLLGRPRVGRAPGPQFLPDPQAWFSAFMARPGVRLAALTPEIAIDVSYLPGDFHNDPADRMVVATARRLGATVVTRDQRILEYAQAGHVAAMAC